MVQSCSRTGKSSDATRLPSQASQPGFPARLPSQACRPGFPAIELCTTCGFFFPPHCSQCGCQRVPAELTSVHCRAPMHFCKQRNFSSATSSKFGIVNRDSSVSPRDSSGVTHSSSSVNDIFFRSTRTWRARHACRVACEKAMRKAQLFQI